MTVLPTARRGGGGPGLAAQVGKEVTIEFVLVNATLYTFGFDARLSLAAADDPSPRVHKTDDTELEPPTTLKKAVDGVLCNLTSGPNATGELVHIEIFQARGSSDCSVAAPWVDHDL